MRTLLLLLAPYALLPAVANLPRSQLDIALQSALGIRLQRAPDVAAKMEKLIRSVVDIQAVDKECKEQDKI